ncbi:MAG: glycerophosphodiester phosphodiesterase [Myxococcota bacterium]
MLVIAHRGASTDAPENTFAAFALAIEQGADMIETDLHLLTGGQIALYHDSKLGGRPLAELTLEELRAEHSDLPTLDEILAEFAPRIAFNLEVKRCGRRDYPGLEKRMLALVREAGVLEQTVFSSFFDSVLARIRELEPRARIGLLISRLSAKDLEERAAALAAEALHLHATLATAERIEQLHARGIETRVYTVDDPERQKRLIAAGVDGIFTNSPGALRQLLAAQ